MTGVTARRTLAGAYVAAVTALAVASFGPANATFTRFPEGLLFLVCLPALLPALPVVYLAGALVWNVSGEQASAAHPVVTVVYTLMFAGVAVANVLLARRAARWWRPAPASPSGVRVVHGPGAQPGEEGAP